MQGLGRRAVFSVLGSDVAFLLGITDVATLVEMYPGQITVHIYTIRTRQQCTPKRPRLLRMPPFKAHLPVRQLLAQPVLVRSQALRHRLRCTAAKLDHTLSNGFCSHSVQSLLGVCGSMIGADDACRLSQLEDLLLDICKTRSFCR